MTYDGAARVAGVLVLAVGVDQHTVGSLVEAALSAWHPTLHHQSAQVTEQLAGLRLLSALHLWSHRCRNRQGSVRAVTSPGQGRVGQTPEQGRVSQGSTVV